MNTREKLVAARDQLCSAFVGRSDAIDCVLLALVSGANFILVGEPGTAKSALVRRVFAHVEGARQFSMLCGAFATEDKVFGPVDIDAFKRGEWRRVTKDRLADTELAFLDEVIKSNDGTLNGMLGALNEREYDGASIPLWCAGAATNWPEVRGRSEAVAALWDRFLLRCRVDCIEDPAERVKMIGAAEAVRSYVPSVLVTLDELKAAREEARAVKVNKAAVESLVGVAQRLGSEKVVISDRRLAAVVLVMQANAWLDGRDVVELDDIDALRFGLWNDEAHIAVVKALLDTADEEPRKKMLKLLSEAQARYSTKLRPEDYTSVAREMTQAAGDVTRLMGQAALRLSTRRQLIGELAKLRGMFDSLAAEQRRVTGTAEPKPKAKLKKKAPEPGDPKQAEEPDYPF